jgi:hypothetical protein
MKITRRQAREITLCLVFDFGFNSEEKPEELLDLYVRYFPEADEEHVTEEIKNDDAWKDDDNVKEYYTRLTDALREYMFARFGFNAAEMTTSEILDYLRTIDNKENIAELKEILETADLVKFAKLHPDANENNRNMMNAIEYVNITKNIEEEKQEPTEKKIVNHRSLLEKRLLIASIVVIVLVLIGVIALLTTDLYNLFS